MAYTYKQAVELLYATALSPEGANPVYGPPRIFETETIECEWGWVFFYNSEMYYKTRDTQYAAVGIGPLFFNRETGELRFNSTGRSTESLILDYEEELLTGNGYWCLFIEPECTRASSVFGIKQLLEITTSEAFRITGNLLDPLFAGKRLHLEWLRRELEICGVLCRVELVEFPPKCANFDVGEYPMTDSIANVYHQR